MELLVVVVLGVARWTRRSQSGPVLEPLLAEQHHWALMIGWEGMISLQSWLFLALEQIYWHH